MGKSLEVRLARLEAHQTNGDQPAQQVLIYPTGLTPEALDAWIAAQRTRYGGVALLFLPEKGAQP